MLIIRWLGQSCFLLSTLTGHHPLIDPPSPQVGYHVTAHSIAADAFLAAMRGRAAVVRVGARGLMLPPRTLPKTPTVYLLRYE